MRQLARRVMRYFVVFTVLATLLACSSENSEPGPLATATASADRWYEPAQVAAGREVFMANCAVCHGEEAQGLYEDWRQRLDDGSFPPPPLDGSAHAWHHPIPALLQVINYGGEALGGSMPPFDDVLDDADKLAAIAYFQSFWSDEIYGNWQQMGGTN